MDSDDFADFFVSLLTDSGGAKVVPAQELPECIHSSFFSKQMTDDQKCELAQKGCDDLFDFVNFFKICYCWMGGHWIAMVFLSFILILLIFKFISAVVEEYLAPAISYLSEWLKLSEAMAAVTLLALANGAGDVITALVASGSSDGISYNVGSIYGAGLFVTSMVVALTIINSNADIQLEPTSIWRDVGMYIVATVSVIIFAIQGELTPISAGIMLAEYALLVLIVWFQERNKPHDEEKEDEEHPESQPRQVRTDIIPLPDDKTDEEKNATSKKWKNVLSKINTASPEKRIHLVAQNFKSTVLIVMKMHKKQEEKDQPFSEMSALEKINFAIDFPFDHIRKLTLPPCEPEKYNKMQATIFPAPYFLFILFAIYLEPQLWWLYTALPIGLLMSGFIHQTSPVDKPPKYYALIELFGTIGALMWTYLVSGILIDLLQFLGMLSQLDKTYLGLTVIAVGNALPDGVTTIALAKQGYAMMGLTGAYAGQLFGLLVGFGLALLRKTLQDGPQLFDIFNKNKLDENAMDILVIMVALSILVITFVFGVVNKYKLNKLLARILGGVYIAFILGATIYSVRKALSDNP